jgi:hypothetical protein
MMEKTAITLEMIMLYAGSLARLREREQSYAAVFVKDGIKAAIPPALLLFWLLVLADLGAGGIAALLGFIIVLSYAMQGLDWLNNITDALLGYAEGEGQK